MVAIIHLTSTLIPFLLICFLFPTSVLAQNNEKKTSLRKEAERFFLEGKKLASQKKYQPALVKFEASLRLLDASQSKNKYVRAIIYQYIGRVHHLTNNDVQARKFFLLHIGLLGKKSRKQVLAWYKKIKPKFAATLSLESPQTPVCEVRYPGGIWKGKLPQTIQIQSGKVLVSCSSIGFKPTKVSILLQPKTKYSKTIEMEAFETKKLPPPKPDRSWSGLVVGGVGLATLASAGVFGGLAFTEQKSAIQEKEKATVESSTNAIYLQQQAEQKASIANILFISGGVVTAAGLIVFVSLKLTHKNKQKKLSDSTKHIKTTLFRTKLP